MNISKTGTRPLVSILIPCYNAERWVEQAIESALAQTWPLKELIVVDDGSTDRSLKVIRRFEGLVQFETSPNRGANATRNRLLERAHGEWLQYLDADDYLLASKIERHIEVLAAKPETDVILGSVGWEHCSGGNVRQEFQKEPASRDPWVRVIKARFVETSGALWRRKAVEQSGGWKVDQPCCQEQELYMRMLEAGCEFTYCSHVGAMYRQWGEQTVFNRNRREAHRRALENYDRAENFLGAHGTLTRERLEAISQARFEAARAIWQYDPTLAHQVIAKLQKSHPNFTPSGEAAPAKYRITYRLLGFGAAEKLAATRRTLLSHTHPKAVSSAT